MNDDKGKKSKKQKTIIITAMIILIILLACILGYMLLNNKEEADDTTIAYTDLIKKIDNNEIEKIEMKVGSTTLKVNLKDDDKDYTSIIPNTQAFMELVQEKVQQGKEIELIQKPQNVLLTISDRFFSFLPTIILIILVILIIKMQGLGEKGQVYDAAATKTRTTFDDVAGLDEEKAELFEIVHFLKNPEKYIKMGAKIPRGVLLCGKPGTGKTLIARAIAGEAGVPFISMNGSEFSEIFAGLGASRVRKLFEKAKKMSPCIIFIDEIDAVGSKRSSGGSGVETDNNQTLNQLLVEMDGFNTSETIIVLAATNRSEMLDQALLRPGRFDRQITIATPDIKGREEILKIHAKDKKLSPEVDLKDIAGDTAGFTGAELSNILNEAAIIATRNGHEEILHSDIEDAVKKVTVGIEKTSRVISEKDKKLTAFHEAGHAIVSKFLSTQEDVKEVSIIPRGHAGGYTMYKTIEDKYYISKTEMEEKLITLLGGRAAEKVALNDISTGAGSDIQIATQIAKDMIEVYGMSESIGPLFLKNENSYEPPVLGENMENVVGQEVKRLIDTAYVTAQKILRENMPLLNAIANELLAKEKISGEEFEQFFKNS